MVTTVTEECADSILYSTFFIYVEEEECCMSEMSGDYRLF